MVCTRCLMWSGTWRRCRSTTPHAAPWRVGAPCPWVTAALLALCRPHTRSCCTSKRNTHAAAAAKAHFLFASHQHMSTRACSLTWGPGPITIHGCTCTHCAPPHPTRRVQAADPEDPWLQQEWGAALLALGGAPGSNLRDAAMHLEVAAAIFAKASQDMMGAMPQGAGSSGGEQATRKLLHLTELDGTTPLTPLSALEAAMQPLVVFRDAAEAAATGSGDVTAAQLCETLQRLCHLRLQTVALLQQQQQQGGDGGADAAMATAALSAVRQCMDDISRRPACAAQAAQLRKMVRWQ